jgi:hypothetical protein
VRGSKRWVEQTDIGTRARQGPKCCMQCLVMLYGLLRSRHACLAAMHRSHTSTTSVLLHLRQP